MILSNLYIQPKQCLPNVCAHIRLHMKTVTHRTHRLKRPLTWIYHKENLRKLPKRSTHNRS